MYPYTVICRCGHSTEYLCIEWPPKLVICTDCNLALGLVAYDPESRRTSYRRIT